MMTAGQQGTRFSMRVALTGVEMADVDKVEFVFRRGSNYEASVIKEATYPGDVVLSADGDALLIPWTAAETYSVKAGATFYMGSRITLKATEDNPPTPIVPLVMSPTLFEPEV